MQMLLTKTNNRTETGRDQAKKPSREKKFWNQGAFCGLVLLNHFRTEQTQDEARIWPHIGPIHCRTGNRGLGSKEHP